MRKSTWTVSGILFAATVIACGGDKSPSAPEATLVGNYAATQFVTTGSSGQTNQLVAGSSLTITLNSNGSTTGHLHLAASGGNPQFDADMAGTWSVSGNTVHFSQTADTFVRNMPFTVVANGPKWALEGDQVFSGTRIQLTLTQQ